jgi:hypothetical protein
MEQGCRTMEQGCRTLNFTGTLGARVGLKPNYKRVGLKPNYKRRTFRLAQPLGAGRLFSPTGTLGTGVFWLRRHLCWARLWPARPAPALCLGDTGGKPAVRGVAGVPVWLTHWHAPWASSLPAFFVSAVLLRGGRQNREKLILSQIPSLSLLKRVSAISEGARASFVSTNSDPPANRF